MGLRLGFRQLHLRTGLPIRLYVRLVGVVLAVLSLPKLYFGRLFRLLGQPACILVRLVAWVMRPPPLPPVPLDAAVVVRKRVRTAQNRKFVGQFVV